MLEEWESLLFVLNGWKHFLTADCTSCNGYIHSWPGCSRPTGVVVLALLADTQLSSPCFWVKWCEGTDKFGPVPGETKHSQRGMSLFWRSSGGFLCTQLLSGCRAASLLDPSSTPFTAFLHNRGLCHTRWNWDQISIFSTAFMELFFFVIILGVLLYYFILLR